MMLIFFAQQTNKPVAVALETAAAAPEMEAVGLEAMAAAAVVMEATAAAAVMEEMAGLAAMAVEVQHKAVADHAFSDLPQALLIAILQALVMLVQASIQTPTVGQQRAPPTARTETVFKADARSIQTLSHRKLLFNKAYSISRQQLVVLLLLTAHKAHMRNPTHNQLLL